MSLGPKISEIVLKRLKEVTTLKYSNQELSLAVTKLSMQSMKTISTKYLALYKLKKVTQKCNVLVFYYPEICS